MEQLLAVSYYLPPMLFPQAIQIGRLLEACGHDLVTVSGSLGPSSEDWESWGGNVVHRLEFSNKPALAGLLHRIAMRLAPYYGRSPDEFLKWAEVASKGAQQFLDQHPGQSDFLVTFGEPMSDHLVGLKLKTKVNLLWLAHFSDPWVDNPFRAYQPFANRRNRILEAQVIEAADAVVFTSDETRKLVMGKYPLAWAGKSFVLAHSFDPGKFPSRPRVTERGPLFLRYIGSFYGHRTPFPLISALARIIRTKPEELEDVRIELVGPISGWMRKHPSLAKLPPGLLSFMPQVSYRESLRLMVCSDLLLVIDAPAKESVFLPSKLVDYIGACRPIFGIVPPGSSDKLIRAIGGLTVDPSAEGIGDALLRAISVARLARNEAWGSADVRARYTARQIASEFRAIIDWTRAQAR